MIHHEVPDFSERGEDIAFGNQGIAFGNRLCEIVVVQWPRTVTPPEVYLVQKVAGEVQESPRA